MNNSNQTVFNQGLGRDSGASLEFCAMALAIAAERRRKLGRIPAGMFLYIARVLESYVGDQWERDDYSGGQSSSWQKRGGDSAGLARAVGDTPLAAWRSCTCQK